MQLFVKKKLGFISMTAPISGVSWLYHLSDRFAVSHVDYGSTFLPWTEDPGGPQSTG